MAYKSVSDQAEMLKAGLYSVVDRKLFLKVSADELEELLCGRPAINVLDWMKNTVYNEPYHAAHPVIKWFWTVVSKYSQDQLSRLVQFTTGTSRIPAGGFAVLESNRGEFAKFCIQAMSYEGQESPPYPRAHTCFNRLTLPLYPSYEVLKLRLDFVVNNEITGFGID